MPIVELNRRDRARNVSLARAKQSAAGRSSILRPFKPAKRADPHGAPMMAGFFMGGSLDGVQRPVPAGFTVIDVECRTQKTILVPGEPPFDVKQEKYLVFLLEPPGAPALALCVLDEVGFVAAIKNLIMVYMVAVGTLVPEQPPQIVT